MELRLQRLVPVLLLALALLLGGCSQPEETGDEVNVSGSFGSVPTVTFPTPMPVSDSSIETLIAGDGRALVRGEPVLFMLTAYDGRNGELLAERGAGAPRTLMLTPEDVGEDLFPVLEGRQEGARLLVRQPV